MSQINLSKQTYDKVAEAAAQYNLTPDRFVEALLLTELSPAHPYIDVILSREQHRPVIKGTRIGVDVIVGYIQAGSTPQEIANEILPNLNLAQVYDALSYYEDHRADMDERNLRDSSDYWKTYLNDRLGTQAAAQLLGQTGE